MGLGLSWFVCCWSAEASNVAPRTALRSTSCERSPSSTVRLSKSSMRVADIPAFDFTRQDEPIAPVIEWRRRVAEADVVVMAAPEYAGGLAGVAKNALDWLVGSGDLYRKPVALLSAGTSGGIHARRQLVQTLTWQGAYVVAELGIAVPRTKSDQRGQIVDPETLDAIAGLATIALEAPDLGSAELADVAARVVESLGVDVAHVAPPAA